jgi:hypothetical protein
MTILENVGNMLGSSLGSFLYHLLLLLAVEAALAMAWGEWRRARDEQARRLLVAMAGLAAARVLYIVVALLALVSQAALRCLPPVERLADTASICLLAWGWLQAGKAGARLWNWFFIGNLLAVCACGAAFTLLWNGALLADPRLDYTSFWQSRVWSVWQMALAVLAGLASLRNLRGVPAGASRLARAAAMGPILFLFLGGLFQTLLPAQITHIPTWERLSNLVAYPLIGTVIYQGIVAGLRVRAEQLQEISQASLDQMKSLLLLVEGARQVSSSLSLPAVLENAVHGVARALGADQCAVVLPEETEPGYVRLASVYNAQAAKPGAPRGEAVTFPLDYQLIIQQAMRRKKSVTVDDPDNVQLRVLFNLLGASAAGPLLVQPLLLDGEAIGAILVGNSRSRRAFTPNEAKLCQSMAEQVMAAIQNAQRYQAAQDRIRELHRSLGDQRRASSGSPAGRPVAAPPTQRGEAWKLTDPLLAVPPEVEGLGQETGPNKGRLARPRGSGQAFTGS